ncbi:MAG: acyl-CoA thioesterase [Candidatus Zixiibacteriota bacterium]|nr:MAG: acyl-CoA thioesterase [candidate division Zixibacteria bacterium]
MGFARRETGERDVASVSPADFAENQKVTVRVRYADTDRMGVVYHANYFAFFESGRTELIRRLWKPYAHLEREGLILPIVEAGCRYHRGAEYDDLLTVCTRIAAVTGARLRFDYAIFRGLEADPLVTGFTVHCFTDRTGKPRRIPPEFMAVLQPYLT